MSLRLSSLPTRARVVSASKTPIHRFSFSSLPSSSQNKPSWTTIFDKLADTFFLGDVARATWLAWEVHLEKKVTINYPFEKNYLSPRFRGEHALRRYPSGEERYDLYVYCVE